MAAGQAWRQRRTRNDPHARDRGTGRRSVGRRRAGAGADRGYPSRPVRLIVPFAAGGGTDSLSRIFGQVLQEQLKGTVVVENVGGAGGSIGTGQAAKAAPDGYTLLSATPSITINPHIQKNVPYNLLRDFVPVVQITTSPAVLIANKDFPIKSVARSDRACARKARLDQLRLGGHRLIRLSRRRTVQGARRRRSHPHPLSRHRAGADRPDRGPHPGGVRERARRARPDQERRAQGHRRRHRQSRRPCCPTCRPSPRPCPATSRAPGSASWRRPQRRGRSSSGSTPPSTRRSTTPTIRKRLARSRRRAGGRHARGVRRLPQGQGRGDRDGREGGGAQARVVSAAAPLRFDARPNTPQ